MSVGDVPLIIDFTTGLNFITGFNKDTNSYNGVGKTTIINAFFFVLFGKLYGDNSGKLNKADVINNVIGGTAAVTISFEVDGDTYEITRRVSPSACIISKNGETENQKFSIAESNLHICKIISGDSDVYSSTIVMASDTKSFLLSDQPKRTKFVENVFGLTIFSNMLKTAREEYLDVNKTFTQESAKLSEIQRFLEREVNNEQNFEDTRQRNVKDTEANIERLTNTKDELLKQSPTNQIDKIQKLTTDLDLTKTRISKGEVLQATKSTELDFLKKQFKDLTPVSKISKPTHCPTCKRAFDNNSDSDVQDQMCIESDKAYNELSEKIKEITTYLTKINNGLKKLKGVKSTYELELQETNKTQELFLNLDSKIKSYDDLIQIKENELSGMLIEENPFSKSVLKIKEEFDEKTKLVKSLEEEVEILNYVKYLCSPEGVKSHILLKIVDLFNAKLNSYLHTLNAPFTITFNELFEETILNSNGATVSYNSLSGGERKRVDLSILFTFRDIRRIQSNISINVTLFDELFDSALCSHGMEQALSILEEQSEEFDEFILIITHRMDQIEDRGNVIYLEKENGITTLVDSAI